MTRTSLIAVAGWLTIAPSVGLAQTFIGKIAEMSHEVVSFRNGDTAARNAAPSGLEDIADTCDIDTMNGGQAIFLWTDPRIGKYNRLLVQPKSRLGVKPTDAKKLTFTMAEGGFQWAGLDPITAVSGNARTRTVGTAFIMRYDRAADRTEVLGIESKTYVSNLALPANERYAEHQDLIVVIGRRAPKKFHLTDDEYERYLAPFVLPGDGAATSQTVQDPQLLGMRVETPDRAPGAPVADPPREDRRERRPDFDQPFPVVTGVDLGIDF